MNPTPEQVSQWALEAGFGPAAAWPESMSPFVRLVTRAMAEQAEADASRLPVDVLADCVPSDAVVAVSPDGKPIGVTMTLAQLRQFVSAAIRANASSLSRTGYDPVSKVTT